MRQTSESLAGRMERIAIGGFNLENSLAECRPSLILSCGFAGALNPRLKTGDLVVDADADFPLRCWLNLSDQPATMAMPTGNWAQIGLELGSAGPQADGKLHLGPWQPCLALKMNS